jgi:hypothetical protein
MDRLRLCQRTRFDLFGKPTSQRTIEQKVSMQSTQQKGQKECSVTHMLDLINRTWTPASIMRSFSPCRLAAQRTSTANTSE